MRCFFALTLLATAPLAARADDLTALYPDAAVFAFGVNVNGIATSPLGKKIIGDDKPFDATRKLLKVLLPQDVFPVTEKSIQPLEAVANRVNRVTVAGNIEIGNQPTIAIFLDGEITENEYVKAAEEFAKAENKPFSTAKLGDRKLLILGEGDSTAYGLLLSKSLFVIATSRVALDEVLEKHAGKRKAEMQPALAEWLKKAKPTETPIWAAVGELKLLEGIKGGVATITLQDNADFRIVIVCDKEELAKTLSTVLEHVVQYFDRESSPQAKVWKAAGIKVQRDGKTVTAAGSIPGKLLAEEYGKQK
jgi:hypothetical protein